MSGTGDIASRGWSECLVSGIGNIASNEGSEWLVSGMGDTILVTIPNGGRHCKGASKLCI